VLRIVAITQIINERDSGHSWELHEDESTLLGVGPDAGIVLSPIINVPSICAQIWNSPESGCVIENLTELPHLIYVNEEAVQTTAIADDGDLVEIGFDQFRISVRKPASLKTTPVPVTAAAVAAHPAAPAVNFTLAARRINPDVQSCVPTDHRWVFDDVLQRALKTSSTFLLINLVHAGVTPPKPEIIGSDLLDGAPEEVRNMCSVHAVTEATAVQKLAIWNLLKDKDAAIAVIPETDDTAGCVKNSKLYLGWLSRPSVLEMTLKQGSRELSGAILKNFKAILIRGKGGEAGWSVWTRPDVNPVSLGLCDALN
jgi:hypothetical protein